ncbi:MAG: iron-containing alcohol dehydrogenase [Pseudomonadota bacterium]
MIPRFSIAALPRLEFGSGSLAQLAELIRPFGTHALIVGGARSFFEGSHWPDVKSHLHAAGIRHSLAKVSGEPSPELIDDLVLAHRDSGISCVVGIGGGSALDAAKAIAGLLVPGNSVMDHLEGVGPELPYRGPATPFVAIPTTAGTGSEATKNAVLSRPGPNGFKKSFRDAQLVARIALVDPDLLASCPPELIAANGMDALTQLLESYVSARANPLTDALALSGLATVRDSLMAWYRNPGDAATARAGMAYAAYLSGVTLAQAGLGSVHGVAAPLGAYFPIPHGVACGTLVAEATRINIQSMEERAPGHPALDKYAEVGRLLTGEPLPDPAARAALIEQLSHWCEVLSIPRLGHYGVTSADIGRLVANSRGSSMKTNPIALTDAEIATLIQSRI